MIKKRNTRSKDAKNNKWNGQKRPNIKTIVQSVRDNPGVTSKELNCSKDELDFAKTVIASEAYVKEYTDSGRKYICSRLRPGFIGEKVNISGGASYIQAERGKPFGSVVAIPNDKGTVTLGLSYMDEADAEKPYPVVGLAIALKRAVSRCKLGEESFNKSEVRHNSRAQIEYFEKRALAYFNPEVYSYSRGQEGKKVVYDRYEEIHARREKILGIEKLESLKPKPGKKSTIAVEKDN